MANKAIDLFNMIKTPDEIVTMLLFNACAQLETTDALTLVKKTSRDKTRHKENPKLK